MIPLGLIALYLLLITPLRAGIAADIIQGRGDARLGVMIWGMRRQKRIALGKEAEKQAAEGRALPGKKKKGAAALQGLLHAPLARRLLKRAVHFPLVEGEIRLGVENAAATALLSGLASACAGCIPHARLRIIPAFGGGWALQGVCIIRARLGTLLAVWLLAALGQRQTAKKEARPWNIPSDT